MLKKKVGNKKKTAPKPLYTEYPYDFSVSFQLAQYLLADYVGTFIEGKKLADFSLISSFVTDRAFYLSSVVFVKEITKMYHNTEEDDPFTFAQLKAKIEQERSLLINRSKLAKEAKRNLQDNPTNDVYKHVLYKALYESHLFDDESSKSLELEELDYDVVERKYTPVYLFLNFDATVINKISRLFDPDDRTSVSEVVAYLKGTGRYTAYEFYFNTCVVRLEKLALV